MRNLKVWQINDYDTWVAETKEQAIADAIKEFGEEVIDEDGEVEEVSLDTEIWYGHEPVYKSDPMYEELRKEHVITMREGMERELKENPEKRSFIFTSTEW